MKFLFKIFIFLTLLICAKQINGQVTGVQYAIVFNSQTNLFDCYLFILEGEASTVRERVQFNAQYSVVVPKGAKVDIEQSHMPLTHNQDFKGTESMKWAISSKLRSPGILPGIDIYGITPSLAPTGFYNKLSQGDLIKLFSLKVEAETIDPSEVRIFNNSNDPKSYDLGMRNGDFSNGFTIGGYHQTYKGIKIITQEEANLADF